MLERLGKSRVGLLVDFQGFELKVDWRFLLEKKLLFLLLRLDSLFRVVGSLAQRARIEQMMKG